VDVWAAGQTIETVFASMKGEASMAVTMTILKI
jgi:hypothetical protein